MSDQTFPVVDIFRSFQGEGLRMGMQTVFVRFFGCNLSCPFCDEPLHKDKDKVQELTLHEMKDAINKHFSSLYTVQGVGAAICLTGGEPLLQVNTKMIDSLLLAFDCHLQIETNGTQGLSEVSIVEEYKGGLHVTVAPKKEAKFEIHESLWPFLKEVKLVCNALNCHEYTHELLGRYGKTLNEHKVPIFLQPENRGTRIDKDNLEACVKLAMELGLHISPQLHKMIGVA